MADKKISALTAAATPLTGTEVLPIVQSGSTVKVANNDLRPKQIQSNATSGVLQVTGPAASATRVMTTPDANFTAARTDAAQTFNGNQTVTGDIIAQGYGNVYHKTQSLDSAAYRMAIKLSADDESLVITGPSDYKVLAITGYSTPDTTRIYASNAEQVRVTSSATTILNGNLVPATAAKGVNFTANTPAAGMTSQLLNWYEEGTWTPNQGTGLTVVGAFSSSGFYTRVGRQVTVQGKLAGATSIACSAWGQICSNLPYSSGSTAFAGSYWGGSTGTVATTSGILYSAVDAIASGSDINFTITYFV